MSTQLEIDKLVAISGHFTGNVSIPSGSVSAPGIVPISDTNTGIYFPSADSVSISTSGTQRLNINSAGFVGIGANGTTARTLLVGKTLTGATSAFGIIQQGSLQSDVTAGSVGIYNILNTATASFTCPSYVHFQAQSNPLGAGCSITAQAGYVAGQLLTEATYNYGFRGLIPSGANRWNIYNDGTAQNYFAGNVGIGTGKTTPASALDVAGLITANSGNFTQSLQVNSTGVSLTGHTHTSSNITDFNSSVSGLLSKTIAVFTASDNQPPASGFATLDTRNSILVLEFDATTDESAVFIGYIPDGAVLTNGLKTRISWAADTATSGNVRWGVQYEADGTDLDSDSFDTASLATSAANATCGIESIAEITSTSIDSLSAGDRFRLKVYRDADDAVNDTMSGDAQLVSVEVRMM